MHRLPKPNAETTAVGAKRPKPERQWGSDNEAWRLEWIRKALWRIADE